MTTTMLTAKHQASELSKSSRMKILQETTHVSDETGEISVCPKTWGSAPLHMAILQKDKKMLKKLLKTDMRSELDRLHCGFSPLHLAVRFRRIDHIEILLKDKSPVDKKNEDDETALYFACSAGDTKIAELLIKHGANVNLARGALSSPMFCAASNGHLDLMKMLVKHKVDLEWTNSTGITALGIAVFNNQEGAVKILLNAKCNANTIDKYGRSPLFYAVEGHNKEIVQMILERGGNKFINAPDRSQLYALYLACSRGDCTIVEQLVKAGANINIMCEDKTPLFVSVQKGYTSIVQFLIKRGANLDIRCESGNTAIFAAVTHRNVNDEIVRALVQGGCNVDAINVWKNCPVQAAKLHGNVEVAFKLLLHADTDPRLLDPEFAFMVTYANRKNEEDGNVCHNLSSCKLSLNNLTLRNLKQLCRAAIRAYVGFSGNYPSKINRLHLPKSLNNFLTFSDF